MAAAPSRGGAAGGKAAHRPTQRMAAAARRGLRLRAKFRRGGTEVGVARAHQLAEGRDLSDTEVKAMRSFFARHAIDKEAKAHRWNSDSDPSAGFVAWLLWGGDAGRAWAERKAARLDKGSRTGPGNCNKTAGLALERLCG